MSEAADDYVSQDYSSLSNEQIEDMLSIFRKNAAEAAAERANKIKERIGELGAWMKTLTQTLDASQRIVAGAVQGGVSSADVVAEWEAYFQQMSLQEALHTLEKVPPHMRTLLTAIQNIVYHSDFDRRTLEWVFYYQYLFDRHQFYASLWAFEAEAGLAILVRKQREARTRQAVSGGALEVVLCKNEHGNMQLHSRSDAREGRPRAAGTAVQLRGRGRAARVGS